MSMSKFSAAEADLDADEELVEHEDLAEEESGEEDEDAEAVKAARKRSWRRAVSRVLGPLVIHRKHIGFDFGDPPFRHPVCGYHVHILQKHGSAEKS